MAGVAHAGRASASVPLGSGHAWRSFVSWGPCLERSRASVARADRLAHRRARPLQDDDARPDRTRQRARGAARVGARVVAARESARAMRGVRVGDGAAAGEAIVVAAVAATEAGRSVSELLTAPRLSRRRFDHDEALRRYRDLGLSIPAIAKQMGVSNASVRLVCDPDYRERCRESTRRSAKSARCIDCGATIWKGRMRCRPCAQRLRATTVREDTLRCSECGEWKPDREFPWQRGKVARRERHSVCRGCQAVVRRRSRAARKARERGAA
jgi:hypothetical protein